MNIKESLQSIDYVIFVSICILSIFGIIIIGSATQININPYSAQRYRQLFTFLSGLCMFFAFSFIDYKFISKFYWQIYIFNIILLIAVLTFGTAMQTGVKRSIFGIQPSEFAKIFMIIFVANFVDKKRESINNISTLLILGTLVLFPVLLIQRQPSLSASLVVVFISFVIVFIGGLSYKYIALSLSVSIPIIIIAILDAQRETHIFIDKLLSEYQINRILATVYTNVDPWLSFQTDRSIEALGSGGLTGKGLHQGSINQLNYLPESHNDFIFAVIGEEFGFIGTALILTILFLIIIRCIIIASKVEDFNAKLIVSGVASMLAFQTFVHVGVTTGLLPNTGIALPFVSFGGSSMWVNMISLGIVMNINKSIPKSIF